MEMVEEVFEEDIVEEEPPVEEVAMVEEEPKMEESDEVEEQSSSESVVADEPQETADASQQEEIDEEPTELTVVEGNPTEEPDTVSEDTKGEPELETELDFKIAAIKRAIKSQIKNTMQQTEVTLNVINEIVSREMVALQPDISSYMNMNAALFDTKQLPQGNPAFFNQISLDSYSNEIYTNLASLNTMIGSDPIVQHQIKMEDAKDNTMKAYFKLKELLDAKSN